MENIWERLTSSREKTSTVSIYQLQYESKLLTHVTHRHGSKRLLKSYVSYRIKVEFGAFLVKTVLTGFCRNMKHRPMKTVSEKYHLNPMKGELLQQFHSTVKL